MIVLFVILIKPERVFIRDPFSNNEIEIFSLSVSLFSLHVAVVGFILFPMFELYSLSLSLST